MSSTLATFETLMQKGLGGRDDTVAMTVIDACINYAVTLAALFFEPPELSEKANLVVPSDDDYVSLGTLTNLLNVKTVYNTTDEHRMWFIPWESWDTIVPSNIGSIKYYSIFGGTLFVKDTPTANKLLSVGYLTYPSTLSGANDTIDFDYHDSFIVTTALAIAWAFFEKGTTTSVEQALNAVVMPMSMGLKERQLIEGRKTTLEALLAGLQR